MAWMFDQPFEAEVHDAVAELDLKARSSPVTEAVAATIRSEAALVHAGRRSWVSAHTTKLAQPTAKARIGRFLRDRACAGKRNRKCDVATMDEVIRGGMREMESKKKRVSHVNEVIERK